MPTAPHVLGQILLLARLLTLTLIGAFASVAGHLGLLDFAGFQLWWLLVIAVAAGFSWLQFIAPRRYGAAVPILEAFASMIIVALAGGAAWPLTIYLVMAPVFVGIAAGGWLPALVAGSQISALLLLRVLFDESPWQGIPPGVLLRLILVGLLFGLATAIVRRIADRALRGRGSYARALALLEQLSTVTRELPSGLGLDAVTAQVQTTLKDGLHADQVALFVPRGGLWVMQAGPAEAAVLATLPEFGEGRRDGLRTLRITITDPDNPWTQQDRIKVLDLRASGTLRAVAVVLFPDRIQQLRPRHDLRSLADDTAAQLAAAEVYAEVREQATSEERRRVSREIHDGVAQDLAALTYRLDNIASDSGLAPVSEAADEVRRLVRELRLSIFDLRTDLGSDERLGTAIGQYAQQVAVSSGIVVHTTVSEHGAPLEANTQHELLRVCQEAVANARRHSRARNMWITYKNHGQGWLLRVADDGVGLVGPSGVKTLGGEGLAIMGERVNRIGGSLAVRRRIGGGTVIEVSVRRATAEQPQAAPKPGRGSVAPVRSTTGASPRTSPHDEEEMPCPR